jgi:hypothetical protein
MTKEPTKAELLEEIEFLKKQLNCSMEAMIDISNSSLNLIRQHNKVTTRYQAKINKLDRVFSKQMQICLLIVLIANTILLASRWL